MHDHGEQSHSIYVVRILYLIHIYSMLLCLEISSILAVSTVFLILKFHYCSNALPPVFFVLNGRTSLLLSALVRKVHDDSHLHSLQYQSASIVRPVSPAMPVCADASKPCRLNARDVFRHREPVELTSPTAIDATTEVDRGLLTVTVSFGCFARCRMRALTKVRLQDYKVSGSPRVGANGEMILEPNRLGPWR